MLDINEMDPSMLIAFLIRDEEDWQNWKKSISQVSGKPVIRVADTEADLHGRGTKREGALDEVEAFDEDEDEDDE
jgi:cysteine protease ATG4